MRILIFFFSFILISGCESHKSYEIEEDKAIQDVINSYITHYIEEANRLPGHSRFDSAVLQRDLNHEKIQVYISDALIPISQMFEDDIWMASENYDDPALESEFSKLYRSDKFRKLNYREFNKNEINLTFPLVQCIDCDDNISEDQQYSLISLSRICFNEERDMGLVVIHYGVGYESSNMSGHFGPFLIKKQQDNWTIIPK